VEDKMNAYRILVGKTEGRSRRRIKDNINKDLRDIELGGIDWIHLFQGRKHWRDLVNTVINVLVP
jgi:hypothetical protein